MIDFQLANNFIPNEKFAVLTTYTSQNTTLGIEKS